MVVGRLLGLSLFALALLARPSWAWDPKDHRRIAALAIKHSPPALASFLRDNLDEVLRGSVDPDRKFMDTENHTYHVDDGTRNNPDHVAYLSSALVEMMRNRAPRERVAYWFGALSHYVADMDQPLHASDRDRRENAYHLLFESLGYGFESHAQILGFPLDVKVGGALAGWQFRFDGKHDAIDDVRAWQIENARWSYRFYDEISGRYTGRLAFDAGRLAEIFRTCITESTNDVIDLWAHLYGSAGDGLAALPPAQAVLVIDVDKKGRLRHAGKRLAEPKLASTLRRHVSDRAAAGSFASVYAEIDDRCDASVEERFRRLCTASGVEHASAIFTRKGPAPSRLYRAIKVHASSLAATAR
jgi:hypothetical protein